MQKVIVIIGPTAVGKTKLSIELAKKINGEIISADSMQIYKHMDIGTAKATLEEREGIAHYMMDIVEPDEDFNVSKYKTMAIENIKEILKKGKVPIMVGGTGLYVDSVVENIDFFDIPNELEYREYLEQRGRDEGMQVLLEELREIDPETADKVKDLRRIVRALEVYKATGKTISYFQKKSKEKPPEFNFKIIGLDMDRESLYKRIDLRVNKMFEKGLIEEVKFLISKGVAKGCTAMQGLGYKEVVEFLEGRAALEEIEELIKRDSRHYAKRQLTWFRRNKDIFWVDMNEKFENVLKKVLNYIEV